MPAVNSRWANNRKTVDLQERTAFVKNKARFDEVVVALDLLGGGAPSGEGRKTQKPAPDCPECKGAACLHACHGGSGWYCEVCGEKGDMISLVRLALNCSHRRAVEELEESLSAGKDSKTKDLFGGTS